MKHTSWSIVGLAVLTLMLLAYVHEQTSIYRVSYAIQAKNRELGRLKEDHKLAKFALTQLRSPTTLSRRAREASLDLTVPKDHQVVRVLKTRVATAQVESGGFDRFLPMNWLRFMKEAQAKTSK